MKNKEIPAHAGDDSSSRVTSRKPRTSFTDEFKRTAVARLRQSEQNATTLAIELGIRRNQLYKWAKKIEEQGPGVPLRAPGRPPVSEESDVTRLRRELAEAKEELAILKKFDAYLTRLKK
jgi:transposase